MAKKEKTYTQAMLELKTILDKIESDNLDIDVLTEEIKHASDLINLCKDKLYKADSQIKKIIDDIE